MLSLTSSIPLLRNQSLGPFQETTLVDFEFAIIHAEIYPSCPVFPLRHDIIIKN